ncbi:MAG: SDR family NAD(P)-dependent oxidoreductase [Umezawaea sp.]
MTSNQDRTHAVLLSSDTESRLRADARRFQEFLTRNPELDVANVAYTSQTGRIAMGHRLVVTGRTMAEIITGLAAYVAGRPHANWHSGSDVPRQESGSSQSAVEVEAISGWLAGADVSWRQFWPQPPQRVSLPTRSWHDEPEESTVERIEPGAALRYLLDVYAEVSEMAVDRLDPHVPLADYGLSSFLISRLNARLERDLGEKDRTLWFAHSTLAGVAGALESRHTFAAAEEHQMTDAAGAIAVVGIAGRYPRSANLTELWENLVNGVDCVTQIPESRRRPDWPVDLMWGGFLDEVDRFDPLLFNITPRDAEMMDPQERLFLEVVWETLEDAGYPRTRLRTQHGSRVAVYAGAMYNEYPYFGVEQSLRGNRQDSGATLGGVANRVSFFFDLHGPSLTVDTMCSSSLVAIHLAVRALRAGEAELAIAGAVNMSLHPNKFVQQDRMRLTASGRRCRSFGAGGDGFVPSEGAGALLLKPLDKAISDGDRIHAVIRGSSVVHAGRTNGYLVPNPVAQGDMVAAALRDGNVPAASIGYVEAHGAGTALGDPVEIEGLSRVFQGQAGSIPIGSVKSALGHVEAAAGMAGLTKVMLQMRHARFAPSLHAEQLNPNVQWDAVAFRVQRESAEWTAGRWPRRAGVSSFGAGGTIAHVVVEEAPVAEVGPRSENVERLFVFSAHDETRLKELAGRMIPFLRDDDPDLADLAYTLRVGREPLRERLAVIASDIDTLREQLEHFVAGVPGGVVRGRALSSGYAGDQVGPGGALPAVAEHWVGGGTVNWAPSGRIVALPTYPFARMRCWLPETAVAHPPRTAVAARPEVPLLEWSWTPAGPVGRPFAPDRPLVCVFSAHSQDVAQALARRSSNVLLVREGGKLDDGVPGYVSAVEATALIDALCAQHGELDWLDLADLRLPDAECGLWPARLAMLQRLVRRQARTGLRVVQVTSGLQDLEGPRPSIAGARMASFVRFLGSEHQNLAASVLDTDQVQPDSAVDGILAEWPITGPHSEVCQRDGVRHVPALRPIEAAHSPIQIDPQAAYLITGGTRGLGALVARLFADRGARKLVLCGVRPPADEVLRALRADGVEVTVHLSDLADRTRLRELLNAVPVRGVVHCAGRFPEASPGFANLDLYRARDVLGPKVDGLDTVLSLLVDRPDFVVLFSSVCVPVPSLAAGAVDYGAANAYLDFLAAHRARTGQPWFHVVNWPQWTETGGTSGRPNPCAAVGLAGLGDEDGLRVLERVMALPAGRRVLPAPALNGPIDTEMLVRVRPESARPPVEVPAPPAESEPPSWLVRIFAETLHLPEAELDVTADFGDLGVESIMIGELLRAIEGHLGKHLEPAILLEHTTLRRLGDHLGVSEPAVTATRSESVRAVEPAAESGPAADSRAVGARAVGARVADNRVAIIGMACRFPGADDLGTFWANLVNGLPSVTEVPRSRWDHHRWYRADRASGTTISKWGGFVDGIEDFDPEYFGFTDAEATNLDPSIRLFLETTAACVREAGYADAELSGQDIGVFVGARMTDSYGHRAALRQDGLRSDQNFIAAHVAQHFDFRGPNLVVDSACSSSLVSVQMACRSLLAGESAVAVAGGVEVLLDERPYLELSAARVLSPSGRCQVFDEQADGFVPGEGCGVVLLKTLDAALRDGDRIHAVIESVTVNNDGRTMGITTPSPDAQVRLVRKALDLAGRRPDEIGMIEAHGTGTMIGDPIELRALNEVFGPGSARTGWCAIGSVKSNLGHLLSAAGAAGLIKLALSLEHGQIPATLWCSRPNPRFDFARSPFFPNTGLRSWPRGDDRRVGGLSSFGLGGTNAHLIASAADPAWRQGGPEPRRPLPPPAFRRRRLWLEASDQQAVARQEPRPEAAPVVASILDLRFTANGIPARTASAG